MLQQSPANVRGRTFPRKPIETPGEIETLSHIALPPMPKTPCSYIELELVLHRPEVRLGWTALLQLRQFLHQRFDTEHLEAFRVLDDAKLLLQTVGHIIGDPLE